MCGAPIFTQSDLDQLDRLFFCWTRFHPVCGPKSWHKSRITNRLQRHLSRFGCSSPHWDSKPARFSSERWARGSSVSYPRQLQLECRVGGTGSNELLADSPDFGEGAGLCRYVRERRLQSRRGRRYRLRSREVPCQIGWRRRQMLSLGWYEILGRRLAAMRRSMA